MADGTTSPTRQRLWSEMPKVGTLDIRLNAIVIQLYEFDILISQHWLQAVNPDIDWSTKTMRDSKTCETMVYCDEYTALVEYITWRWTKWHDC
jgi:hypothetical protein